MVRGITIPAAPHAPLEAHEFDGLDDFQRAVGGFIEPIDTGDSSLSLYANEEGKIHGLPFNERATALWWLQLPAARGQDLILGDVVLVAASPDAEALVALLEAHDGFHVEVQILESRGEWLEGLDEFQTWFDAATFALALLKRFAFIEEARVTRS